MGWGNFLKFCMIFCEIKMKKLYTLKEIHNHLIKNGLLHNEHKFKSQKQLLDNLNKYYKNTASLSGIPQINTHKDSEIY